MGPKKKVKRALTDDEKRAKAELKALKAEELRKKKIREKRSDLLEKMLVEEKVSKFNMSRIHMELRNLMRNEKLEALREEVAQMEEKFEHRVQQENNTINYLWKRLEDADEQFEFCGNNHRQMMNILIDLHHTRVQVMEEDFQQHMKRLEDEFTKETTYITTTFASQERQMGNMMKAMQAEFKQAMDEQRLAFETTREELKNKSTEEYNVVKLSLESGVEDLENSIQNTHQAYLASTEAKTIAFKAMVKKDTITARLVEQRMRKLIHLHERLAYWRARIATNSREWEQSNKALGDEKDRINKHYQELKRSLNKMHTSEHEKLKAISKASGEVMADLTSKLNLAERILNLAALNRKLETDYDKIQFLCPPLPTDADPSANLDTKIKPPRDPNLGNSRFTSYAVDDYGVEVAEERYFENLNRRFNKVMLEKMAINLERKRLKEVNLQLQKRLENYLDMSPVNKHRLRTSALTMDLTK